MATRTNILLVTVLFAAAFAARAAVVLETVSRYHQIRVVDEAGIRTLSFNGSMETRMALANPLKGHFQYVEFFHLPLLWNPVTTNVLMIGLGGGSSQRGFLHYYPWVQIDTVEIDPVVVKVAQEWFGVAATNRHRIHVEDGRVFLRRSPRHFDLIILDAYVQNRYGSQIPHHLATREFFELASQHLGTNGVLAFNVIGRVTGPRAERVGAIYKTLSAVFPRVYLFQATESENIVMVATRSARLVDAAWLYRQAALLRRAGRGGLAASDRNIQSLRRVAPESSHQARVLTDDQPLIE